MSQVELITARLRLRPWRVSDRAPFAALNADPRVSEFLPTPLDSKASDAFVDRIERHWREHGFGLFAVELLEAPRFLGYVGLVVPPFEARFTPCVEIGWRLAPSHWGRGLATEGARAVVHHAFAAVGLPELLSWTVPANARSRRIMEKLGMTHDPADDFDHPSLPPGHRLSRHVLYRTGPAPINKVKRVLIDSAQPLSGKWVKP